MKNILTVDLEDWYQSSLEILPAKDRPSGVVYPTERVVFNTEKLLSLFADCQVKATFFVLGTVAEKYPDLVRRIAAEGHELASHGYGHQLVHSLSEKEFKYDLERSLELLSRVAAQKIRGYRAPYFSITRQARWAFSVLLDYGFEYDSSVFMMQRKLCGFLDYEEHLALANQDRKQALKEFTSSSLKIAGRHLPFCGGAPLRVFPGAFHKWAIRQLNKKGQPAMIYLHPYELDCAPEVRASGWTRFSQDFNRQTVERKLRSLLAEFEFVSAEEMLG